jgi:hypothetical protein
MEAGQGMKRRSIYDPLPAPSAAEIANEYARISRDSLAMALAAMGYKRAIFQAPRIGTPLWYEYAILRESLDTRADRADWPVLLLCRNRKVPAIWFCTVSCDWKTDGAKGRGIISLASFTWETSEHEAARRILEAVEPDARRVRL